MGTDWDPRVEFEERYAERSGTTIERLHYWGRYGDACLCDDVGCEGWQMGHQHEDAFLMDEVICAARAREHRALHPTILERVIADRGHRRDPIVIEQLPPRPDPDRLRT